MHSASKRKRRGAWAGVLILPAVGLEITEPDVKANTEKLHGCAEGWGKPVPSRDFQGHKCPSTQTSTEADFALVQDPKL